LNGHISAVHEVNMVVDMGTVGICEKAVISRENQTYFGENLQFSVITEGFQSHYFFGKTFSFSSETEGNTNFSVRLKLKVFSTKSFCFFLQKAKRKLNRTEGNTRSLKKALPHKICHNM
jgi:outer membrane protease